MKLTKKERNDIYNLALTKYVNFVYAGVNLGLCCPINDARLVINPNAPNPYSEMDEYPEINKHKPEGKSSYWFPTDEVKKRIRILKQAIKETEDYEENNKQT